MTARSVAGADLIECRLCPRLVTWREQVAREKRAAFHDQEYWGRPVPGFGDESGRMLIVGLAPAAHGANRTGRMFTGDRSGDFLYASLFRTGFASQPTSTAIGDGLTLSDCYITAVARCAPPGNRPTSAELDNCCVWFRPDLGRPGVEVVVAMGAVAFDRVLRTAPGLGWTAPRSRPSFAHGTEAVFGAGPRLLGSYHPSQQNTFTGRLTGEMLDSVFRRARDILEGS